MPIALHPVPRSTPVMKRLMQDLGDLTGLDIVAATRCAPIRVAAARPGDASTGAGAAVDDGRCRAGGSTDADPVRAPASRLH